MQCLFKCFKNEIIEFLNEKELGSVHNITDVAIKNRADLLEIIYKETD